MNKTPALNYAIGAVLILVTVFSFVFLEGPTSVFLAIFTAVGAAIFFIIGAQGSGQEPFPDELGTGEEVRDWDDLYLRDIGPDNRN